MALVFTNWTDIVVAITAVAAIVISLGSLFYAHAGLKLAKAQNRRRAPKLEVALIEGNYIVDVSTGARTYSIKLSISNVSDTDNSVTRAELRLKYRLKDGADITVRLQQLNGGDQFQLPTRVSAHDTVAGLCKFMVMPEIIRGNRIESYTIELTDTHEEMVSATPLIMLERPNDR